MSHDFRDWYFDRQMRGWRRQDLREALLKIADKAPALVSDALQIPAWWLWSDERLVADQAQVVAWYQQAYAKRHSAGSSESLEILGLLDNLIELNAEAADQVQATKNNLALYQLSLWLAPHTKQHLDPELVYRCWQMNHGGKDQAVLQAAAESPQWAKQRTALLALGK